ncbi:MAG TPA: hypothetical protein PLW10_21320, partial [Myxococcota bacterium]|nr:hypothetical protein [Myxococcota bacterium]
MRGRSRGRIVPLSPLLLLLLPWLVASPSSAQTETREFFVDPFQSFVQIDGTSALILDLPAPLGSTSLTLLPQSDPGVSGGVLPETPGSLC